MSASISLDIKLIKKFSLLDIVKILCDNGWSLEKDSKINFLPINDNYNWVSENISNKVFFDIIEKKEIGKEMIGVILYWLNTNIGVSLIIFNSGDLSFNIDINRKYLDASIKLVDYNWYSEKIITILNKKVGIHYYKFEFIR